MSSVESRHGIRSPRQELAVMVRAIKAGHYPELSEGDTEESLKIKVYAMSTVAIEDMASRISLDKKFNSTLTFKSDRNLFQRIRALRLEFNSYLNEFLKISLESDDLGGFWLNYKKLLGRFASLRCDPQLALPSNLFRRGIGTACAAAASASTIECSLFEKKFGRKANPEELDILIQSSNNLVRKVAAIDLRDFTKFFSSSLQYDIFNTDRVSSDQFQLLDDLTVTTVDNNELRRGSAIGCPVNHSVIHVDGKTLPSLDILLTPFFDNFKKLYLDAPAISFGDHDIITDPR